VKRYQGAPQLEPRFVGVDDGAWRKGQSYGTILVDLERSRVIDLLPGRDGSALAAWLQEHPGVEVITRDRWASFAQAATAAAPQAQRGGDRWHWRKNRREAVDRLLSRLSTQVGEVLQDPPPVVTAAPMPGEESLDLAALKPPSGEPLAAAEPSFPVKEPSRSP